MALTDKLTNIADAIREKTGSTRTMNLEEMAAAVTNIKIPTALSDLNEDETHRTVTDAEKETWNNKSNFSGNYDDLKNKPTIPTIPEKLPNPNALTFTGAVEGSYDGSAPLSVKIPSGGGSGEAWELLYETTLTEDAATFSQEIPACSKVKMVIFPGSDVSGWKRIIINGTGYLTVPHNMAANQAYFVSIDTLSPPYITASIGIYTNPSVNGINGGYNYSSCAMIGDSITTIGCDTAAMLATGTIVKIWGVRE